MDFSTLFTGLNSIRESFPDMRWEPEVRSYGQSTVTVTIPVSQENAQLLLDAHAMFAPREPDYRFDPTEPPF